MTTTPAAPKLALVPEDTNTQSGGLPRHTLNTQHLVQYANMRFRSLLGRASAQHAKAAASPGDAINMGRAGVISAMADEAAHTAATVADLLLMFGDTTQADAVHQACTRTHTQIVAFSCDARMLSIRPTGHMRG